MARLFVSLLLSLAAAAAAAHEALTYDRVEYSVSSRMEVDNDLLVAVLFVQREGPDAARLAEQVNREMAAALVAVREVPEVQAQTVDYRTMPVYDKQALSGWRVRQSLRLQSREAPRLQSLLGRLQERLQIESIAYTVSPETRRQAEEALIAQAIAAFVRRAELVTRELKRADYRLVRLDINAGGSTPPPMVLRNAMLAAEARSAPALEPGTQSVEVTASGAIELQAR